MGEKGIVINGRSFSRDGGPYLAGVINATPDSFSDGGLYMNPDNAARRAVELEAQGADIIDIGGESTRPGAAAISEEAEMARVIPCIAAIRKRTDIPLSIDTTKSAVARAAVEEGAGMINDISMLRFDPGLAGLAAHLDVPLLIMHSRKKPVDMQKGRIEYDDVVGDVMDELATAMQKAVDTGVRRENIMLDPGIGFSKTAEHNLSIIARLGEFRSLGRLLWIGPSRKSFIGTLTGASVDCRTGGTAASVTAAVFNGADFIRVHDMDIMHQTTVVAKAIAQAGQEASLG